MLVFLSNVIGEICLRGIGVVTIWILARKAGRRAVGMFAVDVVTEVLCCLKSAVASWMRAMEQVGVLSASVKVIGEVKLTSEGALTERISRACFFFFFLLRRCVDEGGEKK